MRLMDSRSGAKCTRTGSPLLVWTLIAAILIGGLPILTGVIVITDSKPAFTLDICHPIGGVSYNLGQSEAPLIPERTNAQLPRYCGAALEFVSAFSPQVIDSPDPPPPKIGA
jgi:hypothetical protein